MNNQETSNISKYDLLLLKLSKEAIINKVPISGTFELTERCNLKCCMCYICQDSYNSDVKNAELDSSQWLQIANQAVEKGMLFLLLTGGEVFLRPDFFDIFNPLTNMGLIITIYSNGTLISDSVARELSKCPPNTLSITLYGACSKTYESITGVPGSFDQCCKGIEALLRYNIPVSLKTTIVKQNFDDYAEMIKMARNWNIPINPTFLTTKRRDGQYSDVNDFRITTMQYELLTANTNQNRLINQNEDYSLGTNTIYKDKNFYCHAGRSSFLINSEGKMNACIEVPLPGLSTLELGFGTAWGKLLHFIESSPPLNDTCMSCEMLSQCPRCPGWSYTETGSLNNPVPYLCEFAKVMERNSY